MNQANSILTTLIHRNQISALCPNEVYNQEISNQILNMKKELHPAFCAGLLLLNDDIQNAHQQVQNEKDSLSNYWHMLIHRQEGDFDNAQYWCERVGEHAIHKSLYVQAIEVCTEFTRWEKWNATLFIEEIKKNKEDKKENTDVLRQIQWREFSLLSEYNWQKSPIK